RQGIAEPGAAARSRALEPAHLSDDRDHSAKSKGGCASSRSGAPENPRCGEGTRQGGKPALDAAPRQRLAAWFRARRKGYRSADRSRLHARGDDALSSTRASLGRASPRPAAKIEFVLVRS